MNPRELFQGQRGGVEAAPAGVPIGDILIGKRHRSDMGDIESLAESIDAVGLLHPIVVTPDNKLIAGKRRLEACRHLGWTEVPATVVPLDDIVRGELAEFS